MLAFITLSSINYRPTDCIFKTAAIFELRGQDLRGNDIHGRRINTRRYLCEALVDFQAHFNAPNRNFPRNLINLYDLFLAEFKSRFKYKFHDLEKGFGFRF